MKTLKNIFAIRRFLAFALVFTIAIGIFGSTTTFASEASTYGIINHTICSGSSHDYISDNYKEFSFTVREPGMYYVSFFYENYSGNIQKNGDLQILNSSNERVASCTLTTSPTGGTGYFTLEKGNYKARVYPGEKPYMFSFNIYWKEYK